MGVEMASQTKSFFPVFLSSESYSPAAQDFCYKVSHTAFPILSFCSVLFRGLILSFFIPEFYMGLIFLSRKKIKFEVLPIVEFE